MSSEKYSLRYAKSEEGEWCVSVADLSNWLLSIVDGDNASKDQCELVKLLIDTIDRGRGATFTKFITEKEAKENAIIFAIEQLEELLNGINETYALYDVLKDKIISLKSQLP